ncbi:EpsG family protein [Empedobacter falsenii]
MFIFPVLGVFSFLKSGNINRYAPSFFFFLVFFGVFFVVPTSGDAYRQYQDFIGFSAINFAEFWEEFVDILTFQSGNETDIYAFTSKFLLSRISDSASLFFGFHAFTFALVYVATLKLVLKNIQVHKTFLTTFFFLLVILVAPISKIQYVRYYFAGWLFIYGALKILKTKNYKNYVFIILSILVHFSFVVPAILFIGYFFLRKRIYLWMVIAVFAFTSNSFLSQFTSSISTFSQTNFGGSQLQSKTAAYTENEEYIEQRGQRFEERAWYANPAKYLRWAYNVILLTLISLILLKKIKIKKSLLNLFTFSLFLFSIGQLGNAFASLGERLEQIFFIVFSVFCLYYFYNNKNKLLNNIAYACTPLYSIFLVMSIREIFSVGDLFVFIGNPLFAFLADRVSVLSLISS